MIIKSSNPLSDGDINKIREVLTEANCVNSAMKQAFPDRYTRMDRGVMYFGNHSYDYQYVVTSRVVTKEAGACGGQ